MVRAETQWILKLIDKVTAPMKAINRITDSTVGKMGRVQAAIDKMTNRASVLKKRLTGISIGVGVFAALSYGSIQFEQSMAKANTMAGLSQKEFALVNSQVQDIASNAAIAKTQLGEGLYQTISNGVPSDNWISFLNDSTKAAVGGVADMNEVVGVTSTLIKNYKLDWEDSLSVMDKIQKTAVLGKTSFQELGSALPRVTVSAKTLGVDINELLGTFSALTGVTGNTAEVSTQLKAVFTALIKPTSEATKVAKDLGMVFNATSIQKAGGLANFLDILKSKVEDFSKTKGIDPTEIYGKLFGSSEAITSVLSLLGSENEKFISSISEIQNASGTIDKAFDIMNTTFSGQLQIMRNNFGNVMDGIVQSIMPLGTILFTVVGYVFGFIESFGKSHPVIARTTVLIIAGSVALYGMVTTIGLVNVGLKLMKLNLIKNLAAIKLFAFNIGQSIGAMFKFTLSIGKWLFFNSLFVIGMGISAVQAVGGYILSIISATAAQLGLNIAMTANPIGLIIVGFAAIVTAVILVIKYWDWLKVKLVDLGKFLIKWSPFGIFWQAIDYLFPELTATVSDFFSGLVDGIKKAFSWIGDIIGWVKGLFSNGFSTEVKIDPKVGKGFPIIPEDGEPAWGPLAPKDKSEFKRQFDPNALDTSGSKGKAGSKGSSGLSESGGKGTSKQITMNLDISNVFNVSGNLEKVNEFADKVVARINDRLRDTMVQYG